MSADENAVEAAPVEQPGGKSLFLAVFPPIILPIFLGTVDATIVATALPALAAYFGNVERIAWVVIAYLVANTVAAPVYGQLGDRFGRKKLMQVALVFFIASSLLCAVTASLAALVAARVLQGLGGGGLMTLSQALIGESVPPRERGRFQGYTAAVIVSASTFGPVVGGFLTEWFGWRSVFLVNLPLGLLAMVLVSRLRVRTIVPRRASFDWLGLALLTIFITSLLLGLEQAQRLDLARLGGLVAFLGVSLCALLGLVVWERRAATPLLPPTLLRHPALWRADAMAAFSGASLIAMVTFLPIYLEVVGGATPGQTGYLLLPLTAGVGTGSLVTGRLISATGRTAMIPGTALIVTGISLVAAALLAPHLSPAELAGLIAAGGFFQGSAMPVAQVTAQHVAGPGMLGAAAGSVQLTRALGSALGVSIVGAVLFATLSARDPHVAALFADMVEHGRAASAGSAVVAPLAARAMIADAFRAGFATISVFSFAIVLLSWSMPLRRI